MRYFIDTEFATVLTDDPPPRQPGSPGRDRTIIPISLAVVRGDGAEGYWVLRHDEEAARAAVPWLADHVYPWLPPRGRWLDREDAAAGILTMFSGDPAPELWAYWVTGQRDLFVMRSLFDDPPAWMASSRNLRALAAERGVPREEWPPPPERHHDALADARWDRELFELLEARA